MNDIETVSTKTNWSEIAIICAVVILGVAMLYCGKEAANPTPAAPHVDTSLPPPTKLFPNSDVKIPAELDARIHTLRVNEWKGNLYEEVVRLMARGASMRVAFGTVMIAQREVKKSDAYTALTDYDRATLDEATELFQSEMIELVPSEGAKPTQ